MRNYLARESVPTEVVGPSRTKQSFKDECDVNVVVRKYVRGEAVQPNLREPVYGDFTLATDLQSALELVADATEVFEELPSAVRKAAGNSMVQLLAMLATEDGAQALVDAGLEVVLPEPAAAPAAAPAAPAAPAQAPPAPAEPEASPPTGGGGS